MLALLAGLTLAWSQAIAEQPADSTPRWALSSLYTHSSLSNGRGDWNQLNSELLYNASPQWILGGQVDVRSRYATSDTLYGVNASFLPSKAWKLHASALVASDAAFSPTGSYALGAEWRATPRVSILLDARRFEFPTGGLNELRPGVIMWFGDDTTVLSARYTAGRAFGSTAYNAYSLRADHDFSSGQRLSLGYAHGIDPEQDPTTVPKVLLSEGDLYTAYYHFPLRSGWNLILGLEHEERRAAYVRTGLSIGFAGRF